MMKAVQLQKMNPIWDFGALPSFPRNLVVVVDEETFVVDVIPSTRGAEPPEPLNLDSLSTLASDNDRIDALMAKTTPILEDDWMLRFDFPNFVGLQVHEEFAESAFFTDPYRSYICNNAGVTHFLYEVIDSPWVEHLKKDVTKWTEYVRHYRFISYTTYLDVLSEPPEVERLLNPRADRGV